MNWEMLVANQKCVHAKSARDRQPSIKRLSGRSRSTPDQAFMSSSKFSFMVEFFNGFEFFLPT